MAKLTTTSADLATSVLSGTFNNVGHSSVAAMHKDFNLTVAGSGTVQLERSFDGGSTFYPVAINVSGAIASWAVNPAGFSLDCYEVEAGMLYRLVCTAFTSTITYRLSQ